MDSKKEVALTFDDGDKSLYKTAYPLLKKYGFNAVAFIVSRLINDEYEDGGWGPWRELLCSWLEMLEMHRKGIFDFQAHSMYYHTIFISPKIIDYINPEMSFSFLKDDFFPVLDKESQPILPDLLPLGLLLYELASRFGEQLGYKDSPSLR